MNDSHVKAHNDSTEEKYEITFDLIDSNIIKR